MKITNRLKLNITDCKRSLRVTISNDKIKRPLTMSDIQRKMKWKHLCVDENGEILKDEKNVKRSIRRARVNIVDLAMANDFEYFGTITINGKWHDISNPVAILDRLLKYFNNYKSRSAPNFERLVVPEYGEKNGRLHFHFLLKGIPQADLFINEYKYLDWQPIRERFGHVQITKIKGSDEDRIRVAKYCSKYMTKDNIQIRSHRYFRSKNLGKPIHSFIGFPNVALAVRYWLLSHGYTQYSQTKYGESFCLYGNDLEWFYNSVEMISNCINRSFLKALKLGIIERNVLELTDKVSYKKKRSRALSIEEQKNFIQALEGRRAKWIMLFYLHTGVRRAEALEILWSDIDKERRLIRVRGTKTENSDRFIILTDEVASILEGQKAQCEKEKINDKRIFPYSKQQMSRTFSELCPNHHLHDLRHTFITRCAECGVNVSVCQQLVGHTTSDMTLNVYMHVMDEFKRKEALKFTIFPKF